jgi:hypothetical protein
MILQFYRIIIQWTIDDQLMTAILRKAPPNPDRQMIQFRANYRNLLTVAPIRNGATGRLRAGTNTDS